MTLSAHQRYGSIFFVMAVALAVGLGLGVPSLGWVGCWLIAVTVTALSAYGFDKQAARAGWLRVPERVLLLLSFSGGTLGALAGMRLFRHKTAKQSFRVKFWLVTAAQIAIVVSYYVWLQARLVSMSPALDSSFDHTIFEYGVGSLTAHGILYVEGGATGGANGHGILCVDYLVEISLEDVTFSNAMTCDVYQRGVINATNTLYNLCAP